MRNVTPSLFLLGTLTFTNSCTNSTVSFSVTSDGVSITSGGTFSLGIVPVNFDAGANTFTISNTGSKTVAITDISLSGSDSAHFSIVEEPGSSLEPNQTTDFQIKFLPTSSGAKSIQLTLTSDLGERTTTLTGATNFGSTFVDGGAVTGINKDATKSANLVQLTSFDSALYSIWAESDGSNSQMRVAKFNGNDDSPSYTFVDGNGAQGINYSVTRSASMPQLSVHDEKLYATWHESTASGANQIRVAVYNNSDSSPDWTFVDGNLATGINKDSTRGASTPQLESFNSKLYAAWSETNGTRSQIRVSVYNGNDSSPGWTFVDGGSAVAGLNKDSSKNAETVQLTEFNDKLYATWNESDGTTNQARVAVYNGNDSSPSWSFVDGNAATGLNHDTSKNAGEEQLTVLNGTLYLVWRETNGTAQQIRVKVFNGNDSSPVWTSVDGGGTAGLNKNSNEHAENCEMTTWREKAYVTWKENNSSEGQIRVAVFNGDSDSPEWELIDGDSSTGLNKDTGEYANGSQLTVFNNKMYLGWYEDYGAGEIDQIRLRVGNY